MSPRLASLAPRERTPLCRACSVDEFETWLAGAKAGERLVWATGAQMDPRHVTARHVRQCIDTRRVRTFQKRREDGEGFNFIAERLTLPEAGEGAFGQGSGALSGARADMGVVAVPRAPTEPEAESDLGRALALLRATAEADAPCPTNRMIALALGLSDTEAAGHLIRKLASAGHIAVQNRGPRITRIVTITATGQRTSDAQIAIGKGFEKGAGK